MKGLNKKGFTLVELLAVIIILAIVVGITIPAVLNTINDSKNKAMGVAVEAAQKWLEDQAMIYNTDTTLADSTFSTSTPSLLSLAGMTSGSAINLSSTQITAVGLKATDVTAVTATPKGDGKVCVQITEIPTTSQYYTTENWNTDGTAKATAKNKSSHC